MSVQEARAVMEGAKDTPMIVKKIKTEAGRKIALQVNAVMGEITRALTQALQKELNEKIEKQLGPNSEYVKEIT